MYIAILAILLIAELVYFQIADKFNIIDKPNERSSHTRITLRGGGIVFLIGAWIYTAFYGFTYPYFLLGLTTIAGISFADDIHSLPNRWRLLIQVISMFLLFYELDILNLESWWIVVVGLIVCVGIINAYNFMDGINGITGGYSLVVLLPLMYLNRSLNFIDEKFLIVIGLSILVFCFFNFRKQAKCFAGDVGSIGIAFILIFVLGKLILKTGNPLYLLFLAVYGTDSILTIIHRILLHENIGKAHRKHIYQLMANELKIPHVVVSVIYMSLQLVISMGLIFLPINNWLYAFGILTLLSILYMQFIKKYYHLHEEYLQSMKSNKK